MEKKMSGQHEVSVAALDAQGVLRAALSDLVTAGLSAFTQWLEQHAPLSSADYSDPRIDGGDADDTAPDDDVGEAALLLGVAIGASADEIRGAFRRCVKAELATDSGFHDHGGEATDPRAQRLIAAKNLLIEHSRKEQSYAS
jgi:hypothetical protein